MLQIFFYKQISIRYFIMAWINWTQSTSLVTKVCLSVAEKCDQPVLIYEKSTPVSKYYAFSVYCAKIKVVSGLEN